MLSMTQILTAARTSRDTIHNIQETQLAGPAILDLIERDLRALDVYDRAADSLLRVNDRVAVGLDADSLDFVCTTESLVAIEVDKRFVRADRNEVGYRLRPHPSDDDFLELYRREAFGVDEDPFEGGNFIFLHDRVKHFDVQVYEEDGPDAEPIEGWTVEDEKTGLPLRLEVSLTLELAPRIMREQLKIAPVDKRTVTYKRVIRLPQALHQALEVVPVPVVPEIKKPNAAGESQEG